MIRDSSLPAMMFIMSNPKMLGSMIFSVSNRQTIEDEDRMSLILRFPFKSLRDAALFASYPEAIENTVKIVEQCNITLILHHTLPSMRFEGLHHQYLRHLCRV